MRGLAIAVLVIGAAGLAQDGGVPEKVLVRGVAEGEATHCGGGARVTKEAWDAAHRIYPLGRQEFAVTKGGEMSQRKAAARFTADSRGRFEVLLEPGRWCFFRASRERPRPRSEVVAKSPEQSCLDDLRRRCDAVVDIPAKGPAPKVEIRIPERCSQAWNQPCYRGPPPP